MDSLKIILGRYDDPEEQKQDDYSVDLYSNNLAIFGSAMSGKTTLIKTLIFHIHHTLTKNDKEEIYVLDFGNGLKKCYDLPYVVGYFNASSEENVRRVFKVIKDRFNENVKKLSDELYAESSPVNRPPHVTFVIDGFTSFISDDRFFSYQEELKNIAREGLSKGVTVVIAGSDTTGFGRFAASFKQIIALDLPKDSYVELYSSKVEKPLSKPGRGVANIEMKAFEFQAYLPWDYSDHSLNDTDIVDKFNKKFSATTKKIKLIPTEHLTRDNWLDYCDLPYENANGDFVAGLDYYSLSPVPDLNPPQLNLKDAKTIAIYGRKEFGKSNLLKLLIEAAARIPNTHFCFWEDGRDALTKPDGLNRVISKLDHSVIVRNKVQFLEYLEDNGFFFNMNSAKNTYELEPNVSYQQTYEDYVGVDEELNRQYMEAKERFRNTSFSTKEQEEEYKAQLDSVYLESTIKSMNGEDLRDSILENIGVKSQAIERKDYLTVFVIQSKLFYQTSPSNSFENSFIPQIASFIERENSPILFIFSDVQRIEDHTVRTYFNNKIRYAFLLDDIVRFISNKGQNSVFGNQEISELKETFGPCELGAGFFYDVDRDCISKLKFIHSNPNNSKEGE